MRTLSCVGCVALWLVATTARAQQADVQVQTAPPPPVVVGGIEGPPVIQGWSEGEPIPAGSRPAKRARLGLLIGGAITFGVGYVPAVLVASGTATSGAGVVLFLPVVGPFISIALLAGESAGCSGSFCFNDSGLVAVVSTFFVIDGLLQAAGAAMVIVGLAAPKTVLLRADVGMLKNVHIGPLATTRGMAGLGISGSF